VNGGGAAELAVSVRGPHGELPVRVTGDIHAGFTAEFTPVIVGAHSINVEYNGYPVQVKMAEVIITIFKLMENLIRERHSCQKHTMHQKSLSVLLPKEP
jgi:hypothetical protein